MGHDPNCLRLCILCEVFLQIITISDLKKYSHGLLPIGAPSRTEIQTDLYGLFIYLSLFMFRHIAPPCVCLFHSDTTNKKALSLSLGSANYGPRVALDIVLCGPQRPDTNNTKDKIASNIFIAHSRVAISMQVAGLTGYSWVLVSRHNHNANYDYGIYYIHISAYNIVRPANKI